MTGLPPATRHVPRFAWPGAGGGSGVRAVPEETPVALTYDGSTYAVMMASPLDLEDFAMGFSLSEGVTRAPDEIRSLEIVATKEGVDIRMWLTPDAGRELLARRRFIAGPTGCGLCGIESLERATIPPPPVSSGLRIRAQTLATAMASLPVLQPLHAETRAVHAAGFWHADDGLLVVREDLGRHNALDKVAGALARAGRPGASGIVLVTSRVSVEMVQKTARLGAPVLAAISAPTALALRVAEAAGVTIVAVARDDGFEIFTHPSRIVQERHRNVA